MRIYHGIHHALCIMPHDYTSWSCNHRCIHASCITLLVDQTFSFLFHCGGSASKNQENCLPERPKSEISTNYRPCRGNFNAEADNQGSAINWAIERYALGKYETGNAKKKGCPPVISRCQFEQPPLLQNNMSSPAQRRSKTEKSPYSTQNKNPNRRKTENPGYSAKKAKLAALFASVKRKNPLTAHITKIPFAVRRKIRATAPSIGCLRPPKGAVKREACLQPFKLPAHQTNSSSAVRGTPCYSTINRARCAGFPLCSLLQAGKSLA